MMLEILRTSRFSELFPGSLPYNLEDRSTFLPRVSFFPMKFEPHPDSAVLISPMLITA